MIDTASTWVDAIVGESDPANAWKKILSALRELALASSKNGALDRATVAPDRLIANTAWNLWDVFQSNAPTAIDELKKFWVQTKASGTAVLLLDALSLRELPIIVAAAEERGLIPTRIDALASRSLQTPTTSLRRSESLVGRSCSITSLQHRLFSAGLTCTRMCLMRRSPIAQP